MIQSVILHDPSTLSDTVSSDRKTSFAVLSKVSDLSRVPTVLSRAKLDPASEKMAESSHSQGIEKKSEFSLSTDVNSRLPTFRKTVLNPKRKKALQDILLVLATIGTAFLCTLPSVIYFTAKVSD